VATKNATRFIRILGDRERKGSQQLKWSCYGYVNAEELSEDGRRGPLERGRQCRRFRHIAEPQVGHARQQLMGGRYPEKQIRKKQDAGCGICEVGMRNQKQHKADDDHNRRNVSA
jgi:hypothetical protein